jgi:FkbM family methyltransferase
MNLIARAVRTYRREGLPGVARAIRERVTQHPIQAALKALLRSPNPVVIQVGAYIGTEANDPLSGFIRAKAGRGLTAVLIEPVRDYFDQLTSNYAGLEGVRFENVAIADAIGTREFYRLGVNPQDYGYPEWLAQLGSLKQDRMTDIWSRCEADPKLQEFWLAHRVVDVVECMTLPALLERHGIAEVDLLQIDAEGYDFEILKTIDFSRIAPRFINYERLLLGDQEAQCRAMLQAAGYRMTDYGQDTFCSRR